MKQRAEHDYSKRYWGHDYTFTPKNRGLRGSAIGWGYGLRKGDYILLQNKGHPNGSSRYLIRRLRYLGDPSDMWDADLVFAPRIPPSTPDREQV